MVGEVGDFLEERLRVLAANRVSRTRRVCLDPGIGFGKTTGHNLELLANLGAFPALRPADVPRVCRARGSSAQLLRPVRRSERMAGSLAVACFAAAAGEAHVLRVHDVAPTRDAAVLLDAIDRYRR